MESDRLSERVKHGKAHERATGRYSGNAAFGYKVNASQVLQLNDDLHPSGKAYYEIALEMIDTYLEVKSIYKTTKIINSKYGTIFPRNGSLARWLSNVFLVGHLKLKKTGEVIRDHHVPLISESKHNEVMALIAKNKTLRGFGASIGYPLSSLIVCGECGCKMSRFSRTKPYTAPIYYCYKAKLNGCQNKKRIKEELLEKAVIDAIVDKKSRLAEIVVSSTVSEENNLKISELETKISQLRLIGDDPAIMDAIGKLNTQIESLKIGSTKRNWELDTRRKRLEAVSSSPDFWSSLSQDSKREIYHSLVSRVVVLNAEIQEVCLDF